jgi:tape measure domain-containing protein
MAFLSSDNNISITVSAKDDATSTLNKVTKGIDGAGESSTKFGKVSVAAFGLAAGAAMALANTAIQAITNSIDNAVQRVDTLNNFPKIMENFGVSGGDAKKMIDQLDKGVRGLPTSLNSIVELAEGFVPLTKNTDIAAKTALALNNAILAGGTPIQVQSAALEQFRQALAKGKPELQDWKSLETAMPAQLIQVTKHLGLGSGALSDYAQNGMGLYNAMKDGKISMEDFNTALIQLNSKGDGGLPSLAQQAKNASDGIQTGMANASTAVTRGVADIIQAIGSKNISDAVAGTGKAFEGLLKVISSAVGPIKDMAKQVGDYLGPKLKDLWTSIQTNLMPALTDLWHNVLEPLATFLGQELVWQWGVLIDTLKWVIDAFGFVYQKVKDGDPIWTTLIITLGLVATALAMSAAFTAITAGMAAITTVVIPGVTAAFAGLAALIASPIIMPAIVVTAALASLFAVQQAAFDAYDAVQNAKNAESYNSISNDSAKRSLQNTAKNGNAEQKARAVEQLKRFGWYATGGYTGPGAANEIAGIVHKGEYVIPKKDVDQSTGKPKSMGSTINVTNNNYTQIDYAKGIQQIGFMLRTT